MSGSDKYWVEIIAASAYCEDAERLSTSSSARVRLCAWLCPSRAAEENTLLVFTDQHGKKHDTNSVPWVSKVALFPLKILSYSRVSLTVFCVQSAILVPKKLLAIERLSLDQFIYILKASTTTVTVAQLKDSAVYGCIVWICKFIYEVEHQQGIYLQDSTPYSSGCRTCTPLKQILDC